MRQILLEKQVGKLLERLPPKHATQIARSLSALQHNAEPHDAKLLHGYPFWRVDVGEYRIVYHFDAETVFVIVVGKRNDSAVYRLLERRWRG